MVVKTPNFTLLSSPLYAYLHIISIFIKLGHIFKARNYTKTIIIPIST
jgi:hypothetical protein